MEHDLGEEVEGRQKAPKEPELYSLGKEEVVGFQELRT